MFVQNMFSAFDRPPRIHLSFGFSLQKEYILMIVILNVRIIQPFATIELFVDDYAHQYLIVGIICDFIRGCSDYCGGFRFVALRMCEQKGSNGREPSYINWVL
jgi:uncharacterized ion transporter superfamily protein YfcC